MPKKTKVEQCYMYSVIHRTTPQTKTVHLIHFGDTRTPCMRGAACKLCGEPHEYAVMSAWVG